MKRFLGYFLYSMVMIFVLKVGFEYQEQIREESQRNFEFMPLAIFDTIFPIVIGLLFGIPVLLKRIRSMGIAGYDWAKFIGVCIPALYIAILPMLFISGIQLPFAHTVFTTDPLLLGLGGVVFGFVLVECVKGKTDQKNI